MLRKAYTGEFLLQWIVIVLHLTLFISQSVSMVTDKLPLQVTGDKVLRIAVQDVKSFHHVEQLLESIIPSGGLDIWRYPDSATQHLDVYIPHNYLPGVTRQLKNNKIHYEVLINDVQHLINTEAHIRVKRIKREDDMTANVIGHYAKLHEIYDWLDVIVTNHPELASTVYIGDSYKGRPMKVLKIGRSTGKPKWSIWLDGGIHSREFISPHTVHYIINQLLQGLEENDPEVVRFLDKLDWYFLPVINVDGYEFCHTGEQNRLWRKNRHPYTDNCTGVDLNRNFDFHWGGMNASPNPCATMYRGPSPASEPEIQNMVNFLLPRKHLFKGFISFHSYGLMWLTRWAYSGLESPEDSDELLELAQRATNATNEVHGIKYQAGTASDLLYPFSGGSADWAKGVLGIKYPYLLELRDGGKYGFLLPEDQAIPVGEEVWAGVKVVIREIIEKYGDENVPAEVPPKPSHPNGENDIFTTFPHDEKGTPSTTTSPVIDWGEILGNRAATPFHTNCYLSSIIAAIVVAYCYLVERLSQLQ